MCRKGFQLILIISLFLGCQNEPPVASSLKDVLVSYQSYVDNNRFQAAKQLSTAAEQARLDELAEMIEGDLMDEAIFHTKFLKIDCQEEGKAVYCLCLVEDEDERFELEYKMVQVKGQWLVDAPDGPTPSQKEIYEELLEE